MAVIVRNKLGIATGGGKHSLHFVYCGAKKRLPDRQSTVFSRQPVPRTPTPCGGSLFPGG